MSPENIARAAVQLIDQVKPLFHGKDPGIQGAALAELTSLWFAGHCKDLRAELIIMHNDAVVELTKINARKIWGDE